jgi:hypothetical protein
MARLLVSGAASGWAAIPQLPVFHNLSNALLGWRHESQDTCRTAGSAFNGPATNHQCRPERG